MYVYALALVSVCAYANDQPKRKWNVCVRCVWALGACLISTCREGTKTKTQRAGQSALPVFVLNEMVTLTAN